MKPNPSREAIQEKEYIIPYHYLDLAIDIYKDLWFISRRCLLEVIKRILKKELGDLKDKWILDAGCGDGRFCYEMRNEGANLIGVDFSYRAIQFAKIFCPKAKFFHQDLRSLRLPYKFDAIVLLEVLEHIPPSDVSIVLKNLHDVLKDTGVLIISVPTTNAAVPLKHYQHFTKSTLTELLRKNNFKVREIIGYYKSGWLDFIFSLLKNICYFFYPLLHLNPKIRKRVFSALENFFKRNLEICDPNDSKWLISICLKK
ncbi:MAG: class I SAM-dependent methyltransferase [Thermofilaceae archaeon]